MQRRNRKDTRFVLPCVTIFLALVLIGMLYYDHLTREREASHIREMAVKVQNAQQEKEAEMSLHISNIQSDTIKKNEFDLNFKWGGNTPRFGRVCS